MSVEKNGELRPFERTYIKRTEAEQAIGAAVDAALDDVAQRIAALRRSGTQPSGGQGLFWYRVALDSVQKKVLDMKRQRASKED